MKLDDKISLKHGAGGKPMQELINEIRNKLNGEEFRFVVRGCALQEGV